MNALVTILGPTASGKTKLATHLALSLGTEIISADSRQVYRTMDIGTGKDINEYRIDNQDIPYHLIDICDAGTEYNVFQFQTDFLSALAKVHEKKLTPILCGGTGLYLSAALAEERMLTVPENTELREALDLLSIEVLEERLSKLKTLHNSTDSNDRERLIRSIEIESYKKVHPVQKMPTLSHHVFGISLDRAVIKKKITKRLLERLNDGMIKEVESLLNQGVSAQQLKFYGLEYKYVTEFLEGELTFNDMYQKLNSAIHNYAKKQMTWFRRMEKQGTKITWIDGKWSLQDKIQFMQNTLSS